MKIPQCLSYILSGASYICSSCAQGYKVDSQGDCNECDTNYTVVQSSPFTCGISIERCISYTNAGGSWVCQVCSIGYKVDSLGNCNECNTNYTIVKSSPFTCSTIAGGAPVEAASVGHCARCCGGSTAMFKIMSVVVRRI